MSYRLGQQFYALHLTDPTLALTMDKIESLQSTLSNLTMYDIKSMYNQVSDDSAQALGVLHPGGC